MVFCIKQKNSKTQKLNIPKIFAVVFSFSFPLQPHHHLSGYAKNPPNPKYTNKHNYFSFSKKTPEECPLNFLGK